jgi:hypothetical protein
VLLFVGVALGSLLLLAAVAGSLKVICAELVGWRRGIDSPEVLGNSAVARSSR